MCTFTLSFATAVMISACGGGGGGESAASLLPISQPGMVAPHPSSAPSAQPPAFQAPSTPQPPAAPSAGGVATFAGCPIFTAGGWYNKPVAGAPTDPNSAAYINGAVAAGATSGLEMYFPSSEYVNIATSSTPRLAVHQKVSYHQFPVPYPWASNFKIEPAGDGHAMVLDTATCHLYESYGTAYTASTNTLAAYSGADWDLSKPFAQLPAGQPSAMAAGLSIFAGMVKWEEVQTGTIHHALNIAIPAGTACYRCYTAPASASESYTYKGSSAYQIPYGGHLRLKASFNVSGLGPQAQVVARALQTYGAYMADTGCCMELWQATPLDGNDAHWNRSDMATLGAIKLSDFEIMPVGPVTHY